jgi:hypothetical protein
MSNAHVHPAFAAILDAMIPPIEDIRATVPRVAHTTGRVPCVDLREAHQVKYDGAGKQWTDRKTRGQTI